MKPTLEQLKDALNRYNEAIEHLNEYPDISIENKDDYLDNLNLTHGLCKALRNGDIMYVSDWIQKAINGIYFFGAFWINTLHLESVSDSIPLLIKRRDKLIEIINNYDNL